MKEIKAMAQCLMLTTAGARRMHSIQHSDIMRVQVVFKVDHPW